MKKEDSHRWFYMRFGRSNYIRFQDVSNVRNHEVVELPLAKVDSLPEGRAFHYIVENAPLLRL